MYRDHFGLKLLPFGNTPDPEFFFMGSQYRELLALLIHGVTFHKGLMCVTGPVGSGKTTLGAALTKHVADKTLIINLPHPDVNRDELLDFITLNLEIPSAHTGTLLRVKAIREALIHLHETGKSCLLIIDEAHLTRKELFQEILMLTNMETPAAKLFQILLLGQKELTDTFAQPDLRQLRQRISVIGALDSMDREQSERYIAHRLKTAGAAGAIFLPDTMETLVRIADGIPRNINKLCDAALLNAFIAGHPQADETDLRKALETLGMRSPIVYASITEQKISALRQSVMGAGLVLAAEAKARKRRFLKLSLVILAGFGLAVGLMAVWLGDRFAPTGEPAVSTEVAPIAQPAVVPEQTETVTEAESVQPDNSSQTPLAIVMDMPKQNLADRPKHPYSVQLASYRTREKAIEAVHEHRLKGISSYWVKMEANDGKVWFCLFSGHFEHSNAAELFIREYRLTGAILAKTLYAGLIDIFSTRQEALACLETLAARGELFYMIAYNDHQHHVYSGAFRTEEGARKHCALLNAEGIPCQVVVR